MEPDFNYKKSFILNKINKLKKNIIKQEINILN